MDKNELNFELYTEKERVYFLLENFYKNYIYADLNLTEDDDKKNTEDSIELDYQNLVLAVREATKRGMGAIEKKQSFGDVVIDGKKQKANIVEITLNEENGKKFVISFVRTLANNVDFVKEMAKVTNSTEDEVKNGLLESIEEKDTTENGVEGITVDSLVPVSTVSGTLKLYTAMFGEKFLGANVVVDTKFDKNSANYDASKYVDSKTVINLVLNGNKVKIDVTNNDKKVLDLEFENSFERKSEEEVNTRNFKVTFKDKNDNAIIVSLNTVVTSDIQPVVEKVVTKNIISVENLMENQNELKGIIDEVKDYGTFGMMIGSIIDSVLTPSMPEYPMNDYYDSSTDSGFDFNVNSSDISF